MNPQPSPVPGASVSMNWTIPLQVSITIDMPRLASAGSSAVTSSLTPELGPPRAITPTEGIPSFSAESLTASAFTWQTALSLALASKLSFESAATVENTALNDWGLQTCRFFEVDDTQCFVATSAAAVLISFRGTESVGDWIADLNVLSTNQPYGAVHRGFHNAFAVVAPALESHLSQFPNRRVLLTGHSLGGALATIAAAEWQGQFPIAWVYTYGQPAVGKGSFPSFMSHHYDGSFIRFVNDDDIVPRVPPTYRHVGRLFHFDSQGQLQTGMESLPRGSQSAGTPVMSPAEFDELRSRLLAMRSQQRAAGAAESLAAGPGLEGLFPSFSDHKLDKYIAKIAAKVR